MDKVMKSMKLMLDHITGLLVIDKNGVVTYMNSQCADYINVSLEKSIGKHIKEVFPTSVMPNLLEGETRYNTCFYFSEGRTSLSAQIQLREEGEIVGVLEYDMIQDIKGIDEMLENYYHFMRDEIDLFKEQMRNFQSTKYSINNILGSSTPVQNMKKQIELSSGSNSTVLITGQTGTGKELVAHSIHNLSPRAFGEFIKVNAASMPDTLVESELFGYDEGAFTGAKKEGKKGKFELADNGTLFIDEINQMPLSLQPKLLRVLQDGEIDRVGSEQSIDVNVRIIAATNEDLGKLVKEGQFREDLFYRLNVFPIYVPPLRERIEDIPELVNAKIQELNPQIGKNITKVDPKVYSYLQEHNWPGNIRELHNAVERAMNMATGDKLTVENFDGYLKRNATNSNNHEIKGQKLIESVKNNAEKELIVNLLKRFGNNKSKVAEYLQIDRSLLYQKMKRLGIDK